MAKIELKNIAHSYDFESENPTYALNPFSLVWEDGGCYAILGPSGCGKTTMLNIMSGLVSPSKGSVLFDGNDITFIKTEKRNIALSFQENCLFPHYNVIDNILLISIPFF